MANPDEVIKLLLEEGAQEWNAWRKTQPSFRPDLAGANLLKADLSGDGQGANLYRADLRSANLYGANLQSVNLREADLKGATFGSTILGNTNLKNAVGLESCHHAAPSTIDYQTLVKSWPVPIPFLRGCGLPDSLIEFLPSLIAQPIQFYSCFISYSTEDQEFADCLYADLQNRGVRCWFAPHDLQGGKKLHDQIVDAIRLYDRLLLILSEHSMNSEWVRNEIFHARQRERNEKRRVLFPIRLVRFEAIEQWKSEAAPEISEYFIPDFSSWKDRDSYKAAFDRLLRDLKDTDV